jgi:hypothetical protein
MMTPDVNVLLAALRDDHPHHELARSWLLAALTAAESGQSLVVLPMVAAGVLRVATHPKVFEPPTPLPVVLDFLDKLLSSPGVEYANSGGSGRRCVAWCGNMPLAAIRFQTRGFLPPLKPWVCSSPPSIKASSATSPLRSSQF